MSEDLDMRYRQAKEVLDGAGWLFDDYAKGQLAVIMQTAPDDRDAREQAYVRASVVAEIKGGLLAFIEGYEHKQKLAERKAEREAKMKERRRGR